MSAAQDPTGIPPIELVPRRFVLPVAVPELKSLVWRIAVRRNDAAEVKDRAASADVTEAEVLSWFRDRHRPKASKELESFLWALRVAKVTTQQPAAPGLAKEIQGAIELLATQLPAMLERRTLNPNSLYSNDQHRRLSILANAALGARGIIQGYKLPHKTQLWHQDAQLFEWHARVLLAAAGMAEVGDGDESPAVEIVGHCLSAIGERYQEPGTISKALRRQAEAKVLILSAAEVLSLGCIMVA
jgi:hypothetical protein